MTWFDWTLIGWWTLGSLLTIAFIGSPREAIKPSAAIISVVLAVTFTLGLLWTRGVL